MAIYIEGKYLGTYRVVDKEVFRVKDFSKIHSLLYFGERKEEGIKQLKRIPIKCRMGENTEMAIVVFEFRSFEERYDL